MNHIHHIIPKWLGGTNDWWNLESVTIKEHFIIHLRIARFLNTPQSWMAVNAILNGNPELGLFRDYWHRKYGESVRGKNNPSFGSVRPKGKDSVHWTGGKPKCIDCGGYQSHYDGKRCKSCDCRYRNSIRDYSSTKGSGNGRATMTEEQAIKIRELTKILKVSEIARGTDFGYQAIGKIKSGETWKHLWSKE